MADLTKAEVALLEEKQALQDSLAKEVSSIREKLDPINAQIKEIETEREALKVKKAELAKKRDAIIVGDSLKEKSRELSDAATDVTRLLRKKRNAPRL